LCDLGVTFINVWTGNDLHAIYYSLYAAKITMLELFNSSNINGMIQEWRKDDSEGTPC
jgi:hypothetical protein